MFLKRSVAIAALCLAAPLMAQAESHETATADTVVATVNGTEITLGHLIVAKARLPQQYQQLPAETLYEGLIDQLVQQQLLAESLEDVPARVDIAIDNETRSLRAGEVINDLSGEAVTDAAVQAKYEEMFLNMEAGQEYNASHILVETEEEALDIVSELEAGADFALLAQNRSTGPSGPNGGNLGWFTPDRMVPEFSNAVIELEDGAISVPVQTQFGWHVIKLNESRLIEAPTLDEVRDQVEAAVQTDALDARIAELRDAGDVSIVEAGTVDPALLNNLDLLSD